ncbi:MAG TPA: VCBS repeat-containing protein, partial [Nannocystis sp.]
MRRLRYLPLPSLLVASLVSTSALAAPWVENKEFFSENQNFNSSKVDAADLNGDLTIDLVFANGAGYDKGDDTSLLPQQAFLNDGTKMMDVSQSIFGDTPRTGRAVKLRDIDNDGDNDIILGTTWVTQSQLYLNDGGGSFSNVTDPNLPQILASVGDVEVGDVDNDGDLDIVLANWGVDEGAVSQTNGGITMLWTQMGAADFAQPGSGMFDDATINQMPNLPVRWSWDLEFVDVDNDFDLDILVSAFAGEKASLFLFLNDGAGKFADATAGNVPQGRFALDVEPMDLDQNGTVDLLTLHDGLSGRNRLLFNDAGKYSDVTGLLWKLDNVPSFDFMGAFYDFDSNSKPDMVLGALQTAQIKYPDRLVYENGGKYQSNVAAFQEIKPSAGTYAIVLADFNKDTRLDVAMAQNENAAEKKVLLASEEVPLDIVAPFITNFDKLNVMGPGL